MAIKIKIPRILQRYAKGESEFSVDAKTVGEALQELKQNNPSVYECICNETDAVRQHINLFVNEELLTDGLKKTLAADDVISVFQSVSGG